MTPVYIIADAGSWWASQSTAQHFFFTVGVISGVVALVLTVLGLVGLDHDFGGFDHDTGDAEAFSVRALTGFFLAFGWVGYACLESGYGGRIAGGAAAVAGVAMMAAIRALLRGMKRMKSDGTLRYENAVGAMGTAYVTVPPAGETGGQVTVVFDNRSETLPAIQEGAVAIPSGARIRVTAAQGRTLVVTAL